MLVDDEILLGSQCYALSVRSRRIAERLRHHALFGCRFMSAVATKVAQVKNYELLLCQLFCHWKSSGGYGENKAGYHERLIVTQLSFQPFTLTYAIISH